MKKQLKKGFTLTELVIVIVIIAILAAVLIPSMTGYVNRAKQSSNEQTAESIGTVYAAWLIDESDKWSYAKTKTLKFGTLAVTYNAALTGAKSTSDVKTDAVLYQSVSEYNTDKSLTGVDALDDSAFAALTEAQKTKTPAINYTADEAAAYNATLEGAVTAGDYLFYAYYMESSDSNTTTALKIGDVTDNSFKYYGGTYTTTATYNNGAFTYTSEKGAHITNYVVADK